MRRRVGGRRCRRQQAARVKALLIKVRGVGGTENERKRSIPQNINKPKGKRMVSRAREEWGQEEKREKKKKKKRKGEKRREEKRREEKKERKK